MVQSTSDESYMRLALKLARKGLGYTSPNPMVGAVIVRDGCIIARGYHRCFGGDHAEIDALKHATESVAGATLYVTLEPCCHTDKKTPPCTDALIREKIGRVVIGTLDPNPKVNGGGVHILNEHGIETRVGVLEAECRALNEVFFKFMTTGLPFVTLKFAQSLDGRIAAASGKSQWLSGEKFRRLAHKLRATHDAVMVGIGTVLADDPELTVRLVKGRCPVRVVLDSTLKISPDAKLLQTAKDIPVIIAATSRADGMKARQLHEKGADVIISGKDQSGRLNLGSVLETLGEMGISSVLVEGGAQVITSFLKQGLVDRLVVAVAPKIVGKGIEAVGDLQVDDVNKALALTYTKTYRLGDDLVIEARLKPDL